MKRAASVILIVLLYCSCSDKPQKAEKRAINPFFATANEHLTNGSRDSAFLYFNQAKDLYLEQKDSLAAGICLINMAIISTDSGDFFGGQELSLEAIPYFDEANPLDHVYLVSNYNNLGIASSSLKRYDKAIEFYTKSLQFTADSAYTRILKNNIANSYRRSGDLKKAIATFKPILAKETDTISRARILSNYAYTRWLFNPAFNPEPALREALNNRIAAGDRWGEITSYSHLTDYFLTKQPDSALLYSKKMYELSQSLNGFDDQLEALQKLISLSPPMASRVYFNRYRVLDDSIQNARNSAKNQFALVRYETERHKSENLSLQQKNTTRNSLIILLGTLIISGSIIASVWHRRREKRLALEAANAVRESQLKTSKKVHDVVANGLYRLISELENDEQVDRNRILDDMENLYEKSRDISYDDMSIRTESSEYHSSLSGMLMSFAAPETRVVIVGNSRDLWQGLNEDKRNNLYYVLQELMVNMTKHSNAGSVAIRFERVKDQINVTYNDNGRGIREDQVFKNGLSNTGNRIKSISGSIIFGKSTTGGLNVQIQVPVT
ncbi:MAG: tetratricopeptide repeat protein [Daejeonella sp.]|uniref:tetratricopeptide repeat-containing sensor histidine kinase n=1 Tax=Daejeonella sp. TaxID=2805397 RepID=UPI003C7818BD